MSKVRRVGYHKAAFVDFLWTESLLTSIIIHNDYNGIFDGQIRKDFGFIVYAECSFN